MSVLHDRAVLVRQKKAYVVFTALKMDSSQVFGGAEECHSSESGWTMYIGSPVQGEEDEDIDPNGHDAGEFDYLAEENGKANHDANSDDSMASDASSGPSHREQQWEIMKAVRGITQYHKGHEAKVDGKHCSNYKAKKGVKKNRHEKKNEEEDIEAEVAAKGAKKYLVQGSKVRKNLGWGKENK